MNQISEVILEQKLYFYSLFYHQLAHDIRKLSDQEVLVSLSAKWEEKFSPNSFSELLQNSGGKSCCSLKNTNLCSYFSLLLFNQSFLDLAQVDVANHFNSRNEHSMLYHGAPQDCFKLLNPWGTVYRCTFCAVFSRTLGPTPRPRDSDGCRRVWGPRPRGSSLCLKVGLYLVASEGSSFLPFLSQGVPGEWISQLPSPLRKALTVAVSKESRPLSSI